VKELEVKKGDKIVFKYPENGYKYDQDKAKDHLVYNGVYTVNMIDVHNWHTNIYLEEFPTVPFNSVFFENV